MKLLALLLLTLAPRAHALTAGCAYTGGPIQLEKVAATATGSQILSCVNNSFEILSSSPIVTSASGTLTVGELKTSTIVAKTGSGIYVSSYVVVAASLTVTMHAQLQSSATVVGDAKFGTGALASTMTAATGYLAPVSSQTIAAGNVITSSACGGVAILYAASAVTTDTTNTFTAPTAGNKGCCLRLVLDRLSANITLDNNALFDSAGGADVVMTAKDSVEVCQAGTYWVQTSALLAN